MTYDAAPPHGDDDPLARAPGLSAPRIVWFVHRFYGRVREDDLLGPVFLARLGTDWQPHLDRLVSFWTLIALGRGSYDGRPLEVHRSVAAGHPLTAEHFRRWLDLFSQTADELGSPAAARFLTGRAARMAETFGTALQIAPPRSRRALEPDEQARVSARHEAPATGAPDAVTGGDGEPSHPESRRT